MDIKIIVGIGAATIFIVGAILWVENSKTGRIEILESSGELVSATGIHWHPELQIIVKDEGITIPANIGVGVQYAGKPLYDPMMRMTNMHTHDDSGTLHWEVMKGPVKKEDVRLANFFAIWGKRFDEQCIFDFCSGPEGTVKMFVNGQPSAEFQNYPVQDGDKIGIRYE